MKLIKRLENTATFMEDAYIGLGYFWCADYASVDRMQEVGIRPPLQGLRLPMGYTVILAFNLGKVRFFKRFFIRIK